MTISERVRQLAQQVRLYAGADVPPGEEVERLQRQLGEVVTLLDEAAEGVGDIPQFKLEQELTPVLMKAHSRLDQARLILERGGEQRRAEQAWELEQSIYRLLNSL